MALHGFILKCTTTALLLAMLLQTNAAPVTSTMQTPAATPPTTPTTPQQENMEEEVELGPANPPQHEAGSGDSQAFTPNAEIQVIVTTETPDTTFDCSTTSPADQANAIASFYKGIMVADSITIYDHLQPLIDTPTTCPGVALSATQGDTLALITVSSPQSAANSIGKLNGYSTLISRTLVQNPGNVQMQALQDLLQGIIRDLYSVLSPEFCTTCLNPLTANQCFTIPQLDTEGSFPLDCNLVSYIASSVNHELRGVEHFTRSWLEGLSVGTLPVITTQQWLDSHMDANSPAYTLLGLQRSA